MVSNKGIVMTEQQAADLAERINQENGSRVANFYPDLDTDKQVVGVTVLSAMDGPYFFRSTLDYDEYQQMRDIQQRLRYTNRQAISKASSKA